MVPGRRSRQRLGNTYSLRHARQRPGRVAEILIVRIALDIAQSRIRIYEIQLRQPVALRVLGHAIEMLQHARDKQLLHASRTR